MKRLLIFVLFLGIMAIGAHYAMAQSVTIPNPLVNGGSDIPTLIDTIVDWLLKIGLLISTIIILWAAIVFMTSGGSEKKVTQARQTLWYAIIGLTILLLAKGVTSIVRSFLSGNF